MVGIVVASAFVKGVIPFGVFFDLAKAFGEGLIMTRYLAVAVDLVVAAVAVAVAVAAIVIAGIIKDIDIDIDNAVTVQPLGRYREGRVGLRRKAGGSGVLRLGDVLFAASEETRS